MMKQNVVNLKRRQQGLSLVGLVYPWVFWLCWRWWR
jgi:hypothetical protein